MGVWSSLRQEWYSSLGKMSSPSLGKRNSAAFQVGNDLGKDSSWAFGRQRDDNWVEQCPGRACSVRVEYGFSSVGIERIVEEVISQ